MCAPGVWLRLRVVSEYRNYAGDGWQYYHLAENLVGPGHRFAFGPPPQPPAWSRLPGYPLFVAGAGLGAPRFNDADVGARVARSQAVLDVVGTGVAAFLLALEVGLSLPAWLALVLCIASPLLALCTTYILSESLAVFLTTVTLWLLLRAGRTRPVLHLGLAGAVCGAALLVRADSVTLLPLFAVPLLSSETARAERLRGALVAIACAAAVMSPWVVRNVIHFRDPHLFGSSWVTKNGDPLPTGVQRWLLTWAIDPREAADVAWKMTKSNPVLASQLPAAAADSAAERKRLGELFDAYNRAGYITHEVDAGFVKLARERRERDPLRYYGTLPLRRARELWWNPVPDWEMPAQAPSVGIPEARAQLVPLTHRMLLFAALGLLVALLVGGGAGRRLVALVLLAAAVRTVVVVFVVAGGTQRYVVELVPSLLALGALGVAGPLERMGRAWIVGEPSDARR